jgi:hypothetical protein
MLAFRAWFAGHVPEWSDMLWAGFPLAGDSTSAVFYPLYVIPYLTTLANPMRFFDVAFTWASSRPARRPSSGGSGRAEALAQPGTPILGGAMVLGWIALACRAATIARGSTASPARRSTSPARGHPPVSMRPSWRVSTPSGANGAKTTTVTTAARTACHPLGRRGSAISGALT